METRRLGNCEIEVSVLGLGTWAIGREDITSEPIDDGESIAAIHQALDCGVNLIDTAPTFGAGHAEEIVGNAIHARRQEVVLATKCGLLPAKAGGASPTRCLEPASVLRECEASLRRLRTDVIDLYQCNWPDPNVHIRDTMEAMNTLLRQGKIRAIGLANFSGEQIATAREYGPVCAVQAEFSMLRSRAADDLIPACTEYGMGILADSPLAKGLLAGSFKADSRFSAAEARNPDFIGKRFLRNLELVESISQIAENYGKTVAQLAISWTANYPGITVTIVGAKRASQVLENVGGVGWSITPDDGDRIEQILRKCSSDA